MSHLNYHETHSLILNEISKALSAVDEEQIEKLVDAILSADKVFFVGVGRVLMSLEAIAKRLAHLGISTHIVGEVTEPAITEKDLLIVGSGSGNTLFPVAIAKKAKSFGAEVVHIGSNPQGNVSAWADFMVRIPVQTKLYLDDEIKSEQPMTSLFEQSLYILGDSIAKMLIDKKNINLKDLWQYHANLE